MAGRGSVELFLPCETLELRVVVTDGQTVTELERYVLELLADESVQTIDDLIALTGMPSRPMLDLVTSLWRRGYLDVLQSAPGERLELNAIVQPYLESGKIESLPGGDLRERPVRMMRELVTGQFLSPIPAAELPIERASAPRLVAGGTLSNAEREQLLVSLAALPWATFGERRETIVSAGLPVRSDGELVTPPRRSMIQVLAKVTTGDGQEGLCLDIIQPDSIAPGVRRGIARALSDQSSQEPDDPFFAWLREQASPADVGTTVLLLDDALAQLDSRISDLAQVSDLGNSARAHRSGQEMAERAEELIAEAYAGRGEIRAIASASEIREEVIAAIAQTKQQLVLVSAFVNVLGYQALQAALEDLLISRSVDVFVVWGIDRDAKLQETGRALRDLAGLAQGGGQGRLHFVELPSRTHAKFVVRDADYALVGSHNFLSFSAVPLVELVLRFTAKDGQPSAPVLTLLQWAARIFPDYTQSRCLLQTRSEFDASEEIGPGDEAPAPPTTSVPAGTAPGNGRPDFPPRPEASPTSGADHAIVQLNLWRDRWADYRDRLRGLSAGVGTFARVVFNEDHRTLLWRALREAKRRLLITSDGLRPDVVDRLFLDTFKNRLRDDPELFVTILFHRPVPRRLIEDLLAAAGSHLGRVRIVEASSHAKVLAWDDQALVSSFNFLSFDGVYHANTRHRIRSEVGLLVHGDGVYEAVQEALEAKVPSLRLEPGSVVSGHRIVVPGASPGDLATAGERGLLLAALVRALEVRTDDRTRWCVIRDCVRPLVESGAIWKALASLESAHLAESELLQVAAVALAAAEGVPLGSVAAHWAKRVARCDWASGRRFEAALLIAALDPAEPLSGLPCYEVAELAALLGSAEDAQECFASLRSDLTVDEQRSVALLATTAVLRHGFDEAGVALATHLDSLPSPLHAWITEVLSYWEKYGTWPAHEEIEKRASAEASRAAENECRVRVGEGIRYEVDRLEGGSKPFPFTLGNITWQELFGRTGSFRTLLAASERRDAAAAARWLDEQGLAADEAKRSGQRLVRLVERLLDRTSDRVSVGRQDAGDRIDGGPRQACLKSLRAIVQDAHDWIEAAQESRDDEASHLVDQAIDLGRRLAEKRGEVSALAATAREVGEIWAPLLDELLSAIEPLLIASSGVE